MDEQKTAPAREGAATPPAVTHKRNYLAGLWAAELLGLIGQAAQDYAKTVIHPGHAPEVVHGDDSDKVVTKLARDLAGRTTPAVIRGKMAHFLAEARRQFLSERNR